MIGCEVTDGRSKHVTVELIHAPTAAEVASTEMTHFMSRCGRTAGREFTTFEAFHRFSVAEPQLFWSELLDHLALQVEGERMPALVGDAVETARFFPGLRLSFAKNLIASAPGERDALAIISRTESGHRQTLTRGELEERVLAVASALSRRGIGPGDRVVAIAPNTVESVVACLAALAVGASWSAVAPNLGLDATLDRFEALAPKLLFACSTYTLHGVHHDLSERVADLTRAIPSVRLVVSLDETKGVMAGATSLAALASEGRAGPFRRTEDLPTFPFDHPAYVLFSSGTTGKPKCIVHGAGGILLEHAKEHRLHSGLRPGDTLFFHTASGWMMWNWLVSALASRVAILLYEGSPTFPFVDALWRVVAEERVSVFGTSPGFLQLSRDAEVTPREFDLGALRGVMSTGAVLESEIFVWVRDNVKGVPVMSISGGTDIIGCFLLGNPNEPVLAGELQCKSLGYDVDAIGSDGRPVAPGTVGELVNRNPFPSRPVGLFDDENGERFHAAYFAANEGIWTHGDLFEPNGRGGGRLHGRSDGILNVRGVRIGPAEIYRALAAGVPEVSEAMAVEQRVAGEIGGSRLVLLVVLRSEVGPGEKPALFARIRTELASRCSSAHVPSVILERTELPTTHSGKRSERAARDAVNRGPVANLGALRNPESLRGLDTAPELGPDEGSPRSRPGPSHEVSVDDVRAIWQEVLGCPSVFEHDEFFSLGGHSLGAVTLLTRIEQRYGVRLAMSSLLSLGSTPRKMAGLLSIQAERSQTHVVAIKAQGTRPPVFWLPGGGGLSVLAFREVSMRLGAAQPVYGFEAKLTLEGAPSSIPEIAGRYVDDLVRQFPNGPYLLFGFSFGSWVAFEMGVELRRRGKDVPLLCVFDSPIPVKRGLLDRSLIVAQRASYHAKNLVRLPARELTGYAKASASVGVRRVRERLAALGFGVDPRQSERERSGDPVFDMLDRRNRAAAAQYVRKALPTFDGRITVILAQRTSQSGVAPQLDDRLVIGRHATRGMEVHRVEGAHLTMLAPPQVDQLAAVLRGCIDRALEVP